MKLGKIRITNKVYFEYYQLYKPEEMDLKYHHNSDIIQRQLQLQYLKDYREYKESKTLIEVSNVWREFSRTIGMIVGKTLELVKDNQYCRAEITNNKATIVELIK